MNERSRVRSEDIGNRSSKDIGYTSNWLTCRGKKCKRIDVAHIHSYCGLMKTKNITLKIDEEIYRRARVRAAKRGTSVSAMVRDFLASQEEEDSDPEARRIASLEALYRKADKRAKSSKKGVKPLTREEIYAERLR